LSLHNPRLLLLRAIFLDSLGQFLILLLISLTLSPRDSLQIANSLIGQGYWLIFCFLIYPFLGWLFGIYTILRWPQLPKAVLIQRLLLTVAVSMIAVAIMRWLFNPSIDIWILHRRVQFIWIFGITIWSFFIRLALHRGLFLPMPPRLLLLAHESESGLVQKAWQQVHQRVPLINISADQILNYCVHEDESFVVAFTSSFQSDEELIEIINVFEQSDPRKVRFIPLMRLFEEQQERFPPVLMPQGVMTYGALPWLEPLSVQTQLKRTADVLLALSLLLITMPIIILAAILIWLEDQGPIFYVQERSGWLGEPFKILKLRTMYVQPVDSSAAWTQLDDPRITCVGQLLRRFRIDELPQFVNVLKGEMSLIGPRPERPQLEQQLEMSIPHYRKRHWMRPGLSGWAQVCAPYASSVEDSDLKLSFDLFYLKNFSCWLDFVILFRTVKTVLKASGR